jgi:hypothetical protein
VYHEYCCADFGQRAGTTRKIFFEPRVMAALRDGAVDVLGCSVDVAWLTAIAGAMFRLFPEMPAVHFMVKAGCRDGPGERQMIGFLSEQRMFTVAAEDAETATIAGLADSLACTRRNRAWRAPRPYEMGICVYVNIVSAMAELDHGFKHVPKPAPGARGHTSIAYSHLNLRIDQCAADNWDFRIFHYDQSWGWDWSFEFAKALGGIIAEMSSAPMSHLLPKPRATPKATGKRTWYQNSETVQEEAAPEKPARGADGCDSGDAPPAKVARLDDAALKSEQAEEAPPKKVARIDDSAAAA